MDRTETIAKRDQIDDRLLVLCNAQHLSRDETEEWGRLLRERDRLGELIDRGERVGAIRSAYERGEVILHDGMPQAMTRVAAWDDDGRTSSIRDRALAALAATVDTMPASQQDMCDRLIRADEQFAREFRAHSDPDYESGWWKIITRGEARGTLAMDDMEKAAFTRAMGEGLGTSGAFGVPTMVDPSIVLTSQGSANPFRRVARVTQTTTNKVTGVSSAGVASGWGNEFAVATDNAPTLAQPTWTVDKAHCWIPFSIEVEADYPDFRAEMIALLASSKDELEASAFATGSGTAPNPMGIITALDANTNDEVVVDSAGSLTGADISKVWVALPDKFKENAKWMMSYSVGEHIALLADTTSGANLSTQTITLTDAGSRGCAAKRSRTRRTSPRSTPRPATGTTASSEIGRTTGSLTGSACKSKWSRY